MLNRTVRFGLPILAAVLLPAAVLRSSAQEPAPAAKAASARTPAPAYTSDPKFMSAMKDAGEYQRSRMPNRALDEYKKANKIAGGQCMACLSSIYTLAINTGEYKDAAEAAAARAAIAPNARIKSDAELMEARALYIPLGDKPKEAKLAAVHEVLASAVKDDAGNISARYMDGRVLAQLGRLDEAREAFAECVKTALPNDPVLGRMKRFAQEPELSYQRRAPAFTVIALDGSKFTLDEMSGHVVLIDFWATWCGPCNEELPHLKRIAKEFAGQPLVMISISWDADEAKWKQFIQKNEMTWAQYRDTDHKLTAQFGVNAIPHYFTIDSDGVLTSEMLGSGSDVEGKLKKLLVKAKAEQVRMQSAELEQRTAVPTP